MKIKSLLLIFLAGVSLSFGQNTEVESGLDMSKRNEIGLNLLMGIVVEYPEISYERIIGEDIGIGARAGFNLSDETIDLKYNVLPYARWYFGKTVAPNKFAKGFFIQMDAGILGLEDYEEEFEATENSFSMGIGIGYKYLSKTGWFGNIYTNAIRPFGSDDYEILSIPGISIGRRF